MTKAFPRVLPGIIQAILLSSTLALIFVIGISQDGSNDVWVHALHGRVEAEMNRYPRFSDYSFVGGQDVAFNSDFLPSMLLYRSLELWGYQGLLVFKTVGILLTTAFILLWLREEKLPHALCACAVAVFIVAAWGRFVPRGDLFNMVFFAGFLYLLSRYRHRQDKIVWLLAPLQLLWIQFHHLAILGIFTILVYAVENKPAALSERYREGIFPLFTRYNKTLLKVALACLLLVFLNESGWHKVLGPFAVLMKLRTQREIYANVAEFKPILFFSNGKWQAAPLPLLLRFFIPFFAMTFFLWQNRRKVPANHILLWMVISLATLRFRRFQGIFATLVAPLLFLYPCRFKNVGPVKAGMATIALNLALTISIVGGYFFVWQKSSVRCLPQVSKILKPVGAVDFLEKNRVGGNIYTDYNNGGYIAYRLYPNGKIFIHSLCLWYSPAHFELYMSMPPVDANWVASRYPIDVFVLSFNLRQDNLKIAARLREKEWPLVYLDETTAVYLRPKSPVAKRLSAKKLNPDNCPLTIDSPHGFYWLGNFFASTGYYRRAQSMYKEALKHGVETANTCNNLGYVSFRLKQYGTALEYFLKAVEENPREKFLIGLRNTLPLVPVNERNEKIYTRAKDICHEN